MTGESDYLLGADDREVKRLGLQHRAWRQIVLDCWERAGIGAGKRVLDLGAGPGSATIDLAEIVGPAGEVVAVERSRNFVQTLRETIRANSLTNVRVQECDLATDELPAGEFDFTWCRWVAAFVDERMLTSKIARALRPNGVAIFHEYAQYDTWRFSPRLPMQERFVEHVVGRCGRNRGRAGVALDLPPLLVASGFAIRWIEPRIFCVRPNDEMWYWPVAFVESDPARLAGSNTADSRFIEELRSRLAEVAKDPNALMITPLVLEIVAEKVA